MNQEQTSKLIIVGLIFIFVGIFFLNRIITRKMEALPAANSVKPASPRAVSSSKQIAKKSFSFPDTEETKEISSDSELEQVKSLPESQMPRKKKKEEIIYKIPLDDQILVQ